MSNINEKNLGPRWYVAHTYTGYENKVKVSIEKIVEQSLLYDFYGEMLNDHQRRVYEAAVFEDYSLSEIAAEAGISRQGVHDMLKRCNKALEDYEEKLHLVEKFQKAKNRVEEIHRLAREFETSKDGNIVKKIEEISNTII